MRSHREKVNEREAEVRVKFSDAYESRTRSVMYLGGGREGKRRERQGEGGRMRKKEGGRRKERGRTSLQALVHKLILQ